MSEIILRSTQSLEVGMESGFESCILLHHTLNCKGKGVRTIESRGGGKYVCMREHGGCGKVWDHNEIFPLPCVSSASPARKP